MTSWESLFGSFSIMGMGVPEIIMVLIALLLAYLAIEKEYEPLLLLPIAFGMLIANIPLAGLSSYDEGGLIYYWYKGIALGIYPPMVFLCIGAMTDFGPLIASPKSALIGLGGQLGIFVAGASAFLVGKIIPGIGPISLQQAAAIGMIGSADGPTSIYTASMLAPNLLPVITIAAYSYMALVPLIQPPIMRALTTDKERAVVMEQPKRVTRGQKITFAIFVTIGTLVFVPEAGTLVSMLMLGNLIKESGVTDRFTRTLQNDLLNVLTILVGVSVGATATAERVLNFSTIVIIILGLVAFSFGTIGGILIAKLLYVITGGKVNPLIGNSGVSAVPMAARLSQKLGQEYNPRNHLLMHAMGPIVASNIGSALIAGLFISYFGF